MFFPRSVHKIDVNPTQLAFWHLVVVRMQFIFLGYHGTFYTIIVLHLY
jgi:hypothetical protein